jgi:hypothetical protein
MIMRSEIVLRWVALGSAIVLLFAPVGERTYWEQWGQGISRVYDSTPYDFLALLAGVVALFSLVAALLSLPHRRPMVLGIAAAAFAVTGWKPPGECSGAKAKCTSQRAGRCIR